MRFDPTKAKVVLAQNGVLAALLALIAVFTIINPRFFSIGNGVTVLSQIVELGIIALPVAFVVMMGCADLSVGAIASCGAVIAGLVMVATGSALLGVGAGLAFGVFAGAVNGFLVAYLNLNTFVVTLGFLSVWGGLALLLTGGTTITGLPAAFTSFGTFSILGVPIQIIVLVVAAVAAWYLLNRTSVGKQILAIGGNSRAAHLMGVRVRRTRLGVFVVTGALSAVSGMMLAAKLTAVSPTVGQGMELAALTVVLLGGVAFEGGVGRISGVLSGLLFFGVLKNGLVIAGVSAFLQTVFIGLTLVLAVALDRSIQQAVRRAWRARSVQETSAETVPQP
ncbi:ABC transporter permease [Microbacterium sp. NPDC077184]|uniref:ABC transporter permease n=1 Tax=Microbacterium sp. NPDC077184 TaxID=3154764 RepID=UPI00342DAA5A